MKILAYTSPARGHLYPIVPILDELARRGHAIAVRTLASQVGLMAERGFDAAPIAPAPPCVMAQAARARIGPCGTKRSTRALSGTDSGSCADGTVATTSTFSPASASSAFLASLPSSWTPTTC